MMYNNNKLNVKIVGISSYIINLNKKNIYKFKLYDTFKSQE